MNILNSIRSRTLIMIGLTCAAVSTSLQGDNVQTMVLGVVLLLAYAMSVARHGKTNLLLVYLPSSFRRVSAWVLVLSLFTGVPLSIALSLVLIMAWNSMNIVEDAGDLAVRRLELSAQ